MKFKINNRSWTIEEKSQSEIKKIQKIVNKYFGIEPLYLWDKDKNTECNKKYCGKECNYTNNIEFAKTK